MPAVAARYASTNPKDGQIHQVIGAVVDGTSQRAKLCKELAATWKELCVDILFSQIPHRAVTAYFECARNYQQRPETGAGGRSKR